MDRALFWKHSVDLTWNIEELIEGVDMFIGGDLSYKVLFPSCGTGEIAVGIAKKGYQVDAADGDPLMIEYAKRLIREEKVDITPVVCRWSDLENHFTGKYNVMVVRGNGIPYVNSWSEQNRPIIERQAAEAELVRSFQAFRNLLADHGAIYFDTRSVFEEEGREEVASGVINGLPAKLIYDISFDDDTRRVHATLQIGNEVHERDYAGLLLHLWELPSILKKAGLKCQPFEILGEETYTPVFAVHV
ncbi:methyltransferase domain-containing protein [Nanoarchaeota archaeon]